MSFEPRITWANANERDQLGQGGSPTRWSNFWIMINSNQAGTNVLESSHLVTTMRKAVDQAFGNRKNLVSFLRTVDEGGNQVSTAADRKSDLSKIESVNSEAVVEIGPKLHRIHTHILLQIQHKTRVQIDVIKLRDLMRELSKQDGRFLFPNPVVRFGLIKDNPLNAIRKYQRGYKGKLPGSLVSKILRKTRV